MPVNKSRAKRGPGGGCHHWSWIEKGREMLRKEGTALELACLLLLDIHEP